MKEFPARSSYRVVATGLSFQLSQVFCDASDPSATPVEATSVTSNSGNRSVQVATR